jgi:hypothetical protein
LQDRRDVATHPFEDAANRGLGRECIERADLGGPFIPDIRVEQRLTDAARPKVRRNSNTLK